MIVPERLLKAVLLIALYSVRSHRLFCEILDYNILFRWFLDMSLEQSGLGQSNFSRLRERQARHGVRPTTLGADKGYHSKDFVAHLRNKRIAPHIAQIEARNTPGLDARTTPHASYALSQQKRKRVEEIFGWMKE